MGLQNNRPVVHDLYEPSTGTYQYVVADQFTKRCLVINPVHEVDTKKEGVATSAPDAIIEIVKRYGYQVDWLLETQPIGQHRTSVYYLRMQLRELQGFAPKTCGGTNISGMKTLFERKYGNRHQLATDFNEGFKDGDELWVGNMKVSAVSLTGLKQEHLGYVIGEYLFGLSYFTQLVGLETTLDDTQVSVLRLRHLWLSLAKVMAYPPNYRIYLDSSAAETGEPFTTVHNSRQSSQFRHMEEHDFVNHWQAQLNTKADPKRPKSRRRLPKHQELASTER